MGPAVSPGHTTNVLTPIKRGTAPAHRTIKAGGRASRCSQAVHTWLGVRPIPGAGGQNPFPSLSRPSWRLVTGPPEGGAAPES